MTTGLRLAFLCFFFYGFTAAEWAIDVDYSVENDAGAGQSSYSPLGAILVDRLPDGNFTGRFRAANGITAQLTEKLVEAAKNPQSIYRIRSGNVFSFNEPCLLLRSNLAHLFHVSIDPQKQSIFSISVFPDGLYEAGADYANCQGVELAPDARFTANVRVLKSGELPTPDTVSYLQKMERERQNRQHGAQQDNRSFIAKYWMYIVPVVAFVVISNAMTPEQGGSE
uniref:ER membrane protein complex subunit 10 n=1 Tax=Steinernema glaseri TaxID=37863 RepID=A0A1I7Y2M3_9BILA